MRAGPSVSVDIGRFVLGGWNWLLSSVCEQECSSSSLALPYAGIAHVLVACDTWIGLLAEDKRPIEKSDGSSICAHADPERVVCCHAWCQGVRWYAPRFSVEPTLAHVLELVRRWTLS